MPHKIIIVGAGIAGLVAAVSLRQAGHEIVVIEKHAITAVVGAALHVPPNAVRVLARLGFDTIRARVCHLQHLNILRGSDLKQLSSTPLTVVPGQPASFTVHRADLHRELLRLATANDDEPPSWGPPVEIRSGVAVWRVSGDGMGVVLETREEVQGDLIVGADGVHSVMRDFVLPEPQSASHTGMAAFRFLLNTSEMREDTDLAALLERSKQVGNMLPDTADTVHERHLMWYACQDGELQNFVGIHPSTSSTIEDSGEQLREAMSVEFGRYDPRVLKIIKSSKHMKRWPLFIHDPLPRWHRVRVLLIGDAAHPMLPFSGQGAAQAMEDGAALGALLGRQIHMGLEGKLSSFQAIRRNRTARIQILSSVRFGLESQVSDKLRPYLDETAPEPPLSIGERMKHDHSHDVYLACERALL